MSASWTDEDIVRMLDAILATVDRDGDCDREDALKVIRASIEEREDEAALERTARRYRRYSLRSLRGQYE